MVMDHAGCYYPKTPGPCQDDFEVHQNTDGKGVCKVSFYFSHQRQNTLLFIH